ncbi:hypothetical protein SELMODRAFT_418146 [Selaginella moellendorffii]|uniref:Uncharacterized protein n=1 Tax=Selaginella moellendorffii TaxID=88036 RepID=D8S4U0_SELML|nr:hypothetical protein SELMODRAFT_418146 [Selaginella moellendorffii]
MQEVTCARDSDEPSEQGGCQRSWGNREARWNVVAQTSKRRDTLKKKEHSQGREEKGKFESPSSLGGEINYLGQEHKDKRLSCGTFHEFSDQVEYHISCDISLEFILAAFSVKSCNLDKTLGKFPDKAEELAIHSMKIIAEHVEASCQLFDVVGSDATVDTYGEMFRETAHNLYPGLISFYRLDDFSTWLKSCQSSNTTLEHPVKTLLTSNAETARRALMCLFGSDESSITRHIKEDLETRNLYRGFSRFMLEDLYDHEPCKALPTKSAKKKLCSKVGFLMIQRNRAYSAMASQQRCQFDPPLVAAQRSSEEKNFHTPTPWHNAVVELANGKFVLLHSRVIHRSGELTGEELKISEETKPLQTGQVNAIGYPILCQGRGIGKEEEAKKRGGSSFEQARVWSFDVPGEQQLRKPRLAIAHGPPMSTKFSLLPLHGYCPQDYNLEYCAAPHPGPILFCFSYGCCSSRYLVANPLSGRYTQVHTLIETCVKDFKTKLSSLVFLALWLLQACLGGGDVSYSFDWVSEQLPRARGLVVVLVA